MNNHIRTACLLSLFAFAHFSEAKFKHVYRGIAHQGLEACLADPAYSFTTNNITLRNNAGEAFACIMGNINNSQQAILSSGASILGLIPTALTLLGNRRSEIMNIHTRLPILAFLLTLTGVSVDRRVGWIHLKAAPKKVSRPKSSTWAFVFDIDKDAPVSVYTGLIIVHLLAAVSAGLIVWQTWVLTERGVESWAAWTSFYPLCWLLYGPAQHLVEIGVEQLDDASWPILKPVCTMLADVVGKFQFLGGTAILAGLALVSGINAMKILVVFGIVAVVMRECAAWTLEVLGLPVEK